MRYAGFRASLYAIGGAFTLILMLEFFFMPESAFHRPDALNTDGGVGRGPSMVEDDGVELKPTGPSCQSRSAFG